MPIFQVHQTVSTRGPGTYEITDRVALEIRRAGLKRGLVSIFCHHTGCSLIIFENADPSARNDLEAWMNRLVPANDPLFTHTLEGADDMPSHIKMALTRTSETIPLEDGRLLLGDWQGIFLWEHRSTPQQRSITITAIGE